MELRFALSDSKLVLHTSQAHAVAVELGAVTSDLQCLWRIGGPSGARLEASCAVSLRNLQIGQQIEVRRAGAEPTQREPSLRA